MCQKLLYDSCRHTAKDYSMQYLSLVYAHVVLLKVLSVTLIV